MSEQPGGSPAHVVEVGTLGEWAAAWDDAVAALPVPSPFLRSWWLTALGEANARFVLVLRGGELLGGLALRRDRLLGVPVYRFAGSGTLCPDHLDVVCRPEDTAAVGAAIRGWFAAPGNRLLDLAGATEGSLLRDWLAGARIETIGVAPFDALPADAADYLAARGSSFRKTVRRARNRLTEAGYRVHRAGLDDLPAALDEFARLHGARGDRSALLDELPRLRRLLAAGVRAGEVRVDVLRSDTSVAAVSIAFAACRRFSLYQTARELSVDNASTLLHLEAIDAACGDGFTELDMLRGDEPYKLLYAGSTRGLIRIRAAHGAVAPALLAVVRATTAARSVVGGVRRRLAAQRPVDRSGRTRRLAAE